MATATIDSNANSKISRLSQWHVFTFLAVWIVLNPIELLGGSMTFFDALKLRFYTISGPFIMLWDGSWTESLVSRTTPTACIVLPITLLGICLQLAWLPTSKLANVARYVLWVIGWQVWFAGAAYMLGTSLP